MTSSRSRRLFVGSFWLLGAALVGLLFAIDQWAPAGRTVIRVGLPTDRTTYYAVAHSLVFDRDFDLSNQYEALGMGRKVVSVKWPWSAIQPETGLPGAPFPIGFSLLVAPFILAGTVAEGWLHGRWDGYQGLPVVGFFVGNLFYLCMGLTLLFLLLCRVGADLRIAEGRSEHLAWIVTLLLWPTTSLAYYSFAPMSHVAGFAATCAFLLAWWRARDSTSALAWLLAGACGGAMFLCRWQMSLLVVIPALYDLAQLRAGDLSLRGESGRAWLWSRAAGLAGATAAALPQFLEWKAIYGQFLAVPQGAGFFKFPPVYALHVLFSSNHGWFLWTPFTLLGVVGLLLACRRWPRLYLPFAVALGAEVALVGSLRTGWHASESFSARMLTECLPLVGLGLVHLPLRRALARVSLLVVAALCAAWTLAFAVQYRMDAVPKTDRLTAQELIVDKLRLLRTLERRNASLHAERLLEESPERALAIASAAADELGPDRRLLDVIAEAHRRRGDLEAAENTARRLESLLDRRLF